MHYFAKQVWDVFRSYLDIVVCSCGSQSPFWSYFAKIDAPNWLFSVPSDFWCIQPHVLTLWKMQFDPTSGKSFTRKNDRSKPARNSSRKISSTFPPHLVTPYLDRLDDTRVFGFSKYGSSQKRRQNTCVFILQLSSSLELQVVDNAVFHISDHAADTNLPELL